MPALRFTLIILLALHLGACANLVSRATNQFADDLEAAVRAYDDPATVASALPAYILLMEARLQSRPEDAALRLATARLTATQATLFADDPDSELRLTARALAHARIGACQSHRRLCELDSVRFDQFEQALESLPTGALEPAYVLATTWTGWIAARRGSFEALADLPRVEAMLDWVAERDPDHDDGAVWLYLAVLNSQRPPGAGGRPELARAHFDRARQAANGDNLLIDVMQADSYARLVFDRDLYVSLLEGVLAARPVGDRYRLANQVARARAATLLARTAAIFD